MPRRQLAVVAAPGLGPGAALGTVDPLHRLDGRAPLAQPLDQRHDRHVEVAVAAPAARVDSVAGSKVAERVWDGRGDHELIPTIFLHYPRQFALR